MVGNNVDPNSVPLALPDITEAEIQVVADVLRSGWLAHGPWNHKFEEAFSHFLDVPHAIAMNSCTSALEVALLASNVRGEVILPSFTFTASANAIVTTGGTPVFCEIDPKTRNVTAKTIAEKITPKTEAVMIVHYGGQPCNMDEITELCARKNLLLIEDSAETLGATWKKRQAGSFGIGCFSFFPTKNMTTAEGGMFTCRDEKIARISRAIVGHGMTSTTFERERKERPWIRAAEFAGHNFRLPHPLAALGYSQLARLPEMNEKRVRLANLYNEKLGTLAPVLETPFLAEHATHVYQMYTVRVPATLRNPLVAHLRTRGIGASVHFDPPVHVQPYYANLGWNAGMLPLTEKLVEEILTLPIYPTMKDTQLEWVVSSITEWMKGNMHV